jgi:uncharacterized RDD family membrane protein YckC
MSHAFDLHPGPMPGLPDPALDPQFYAGVQPRRLAAWVVDVLIVLAAGVPLALAFGLLTLGLGLALFPLILLGVGFLYRVATIAGGSATWGMRLFGLELRRADGAPLDPMTALLHTALYTVAIGTAVIQLFSIGGMLVTRYGQGLPDLLLRTAMINRPSD